MRTLSSTLLAAQSATGVPHVQCVFKDKDDTEILDASTYNNILRYVEHHEEPYNDYATIVLDNSTLTFDNTVEINLVGYYVDLAFGYVTGENVAEPHGNGSTAEYEYLPRLWVKKQTIVDAPGQLLCVLELGGVWSIMQEQLLRIGNPPFYMDENDELPGSTVYDVIERIIETELSAATGYTFTLSALGTQDDGIIDTYEPALEINEVPFESMARIIQILMEMTKCYLRLESGLNFKVIYPQDGDDIDEHYYSSQVHFFTELNDARQVVVPNRVIVFCNQGVDGEWTNYITGQAVVEDDFAGWPGDETYTGKYMEVKGLYRAGTIDNQTDADNRAAAILSRVIAEKLSGRVVVFHDAQVELWDKIEVTSVRGN